MKLTGENRSTRGKTCPSTTLSTTNTTWTNRGSNSGLRGRRPATNRLSHGTARTACYSCQILMELEFSRQIFEKSSNIRFHENPSGGSRVVPCGQTDGRTDRHDDGNKSLLAILRTRLKTECSLCSLSCTATVLEVVSQS
jgi:hypothetical protein